MHCAISRSFLLSVRLFAFVFLTPTQHTTLSTGHHHLFQFPYSELFPPCFVPCPLAEVAHLFSWHTLQGPNHIWSLREGEAHWTLRAWGKLETVMIRSFAGSQKDTVGLSEQRMCQSKLFMKQVIGKGKWWVVVGWTLEEEGKQASKEKTHNTCFHLEREDGAAGLNELKKIYSTFMNPRK